MRLITRKRIAQAAERWPDASRDLASWARVVERASWRNWADAKRVYGHRLDMVKVRSGTTVGVFDVANNRLRVIVAVHYLAAAPDRGRVYVLRVLTHAEYDRNVWKQEL
jgi:mRNA interferase HigB